jgi:hypothetical protein
MYDESVIFVFITSCRARSLNCDFLTAGSLLRRRQRSATSLCNKRPAACFSTTDGKSTKVSLPPPPVSSASFGRFLAVEQV